MSLEAHSFGFDGFVLDLKERVLLRNGKPVSITPKTFLLLQTLVENHGHVVEKDKLMKTVWADSFVEDGNLSFTVSVLRKILGDDTHSPRFIETVPRRGYRFIADVIENVNEQSTDGPRNNAEAITPANAVRAGFVPLATALVILAAAAGIGTWFARSGSSEPRAPVLSASFSSEKLSTDGKIFHAIVSPDGKSVVYTNGGKGKQSIWLRNLDTASNVEIVPAADYFYYGLAFSQDGSQLYFNRRPRNIDEQGTIYRVSISGGVPVKVISEAQGWIDVSPDGGTISFVRCFFLEDENCSLWIADASDGKNEKKLVSRTRPFRIGDNEISPDGRTIAFAAGQSLNGANEFGLYEVDIYSGSERMLTHEKFFNIKSLVWLPNQSGVLFTASRTPDKTFFIWQTSGGGDVRRLTKDSETYSGLSLNDTADVLVSTQVQRDFRVSLYQTEDASVLPQVLSDATTVTFAPNGKIVFSSMMTGNNEIWSINPDGSDQRQLTNDSGDDSACLVSPDNNFIFFSSNRSGENHVWRMNADGSNQTRITTTEGGFPLSVSSDQEWLYYNSAMHKTLRRVSIKSGEEQSVLDVRKLEFAVSPDGARAAFRDKQDGGDFLRVVSLGDGQTLKTFKLAVPKSNLTKLVWSHDGEYLAYSLANSENQSNTLWFQYLEKKHPDQIADLGDDEMHELSGFALSPDGKTFAVVQGGWKHDAVLLRGLR